MSCFRLIRLLHQREDLAADPLQPVSGFNGQFRRSCRSRVSLYDVPHGLTRFLGERSFDHLPLRLGQIEPLVEAIDGLDRIVDRRVDGDDHLRLLAVGTLGHLSDCLRQGLKRFSADVFESALTDRDRHNHSVGADQAKIKALDAEAQES